MTFVWGPIERLRVKTSKSSTAAWRCISRSPDSSYARCSSSLDSIRVTPTHMPPSNGFM
jgi:hypothetical protein